MAEFYKWSAQDLGLDIPDMDNEHQILIKKMNLLYDAFAAKKPMAEVKPLLEDFGAYTVKHFADEEAYMAKVNFTELEVHKRIHQNLLKQFGDHVTEFKATGVLSQKFFEFLKIWLTSHIRGIDMKYSVHTKTKKSA